MNRPVQKIVSPSGESMVVMPEEDYILLLAAAEDDETLAPEFAEELQRRRASLTAENAVSFDSLRLADPQR